MGCKNAVTKRFCSDRVRVADLVNGVYFNGRRVIHSEDLTESSEGYAQPVEQTEAEEEREYLERERDISMFHTQLRRVFELLPLRKDKKRLLKKLTEDEAYSHMDEDSLEFLSVVMDNPTIWKNRSK